MQDLGKNEFYLNTLDTNIMDETSSALMAWREKILRIILVVGLAAGIFVFVPMIALAVEQHIWTLPILNSVFYAVGVAVFVLKKIRFETRAGTTLTLIFLAGLSTIWNVGLLSGGPICLFTFAILAGLLLGFWAAVGALTVNAVTLLFFGWLAGQGGWQPEQSFYTSTVRGVSVWFTFMLMNSIAALATAALVQGLQDIAGKLHKTFSMLRLENDRVLQEVKERVRIQKALSESEARFRRLAENAKDMIYRMSLPDGVYQYVSPAAYDLTGYAPEEFYAEPLMIQRLIHPDSMDYFKLSWADLLNENMSSNYEFQIIHRSGDLRWIFQRNVLIQDAHGKPSAIEGIVTDITQIKRTEEHLKGFKKAVENSSDAIGMSTPEGVHWYQNKSFDELFGEIGNDPPSTLYVDSQQGREVFQTIMAGNQWNGEVMMNGRDGRVLNVFLRAYSVKDSKGDVKGLVGVHTDMTVLKKAQQEREELSQELKGALKSIEALHGLLPICSGCKKIRDDQGYWNQLETYIEAHSKALFTHSLCPDCMKDFYGDTSWYKKKKP